MLARPRSDPDPIDTHAAVGGLVEAFDEVLDLRQHLLIPHGLGRLVERPSSWLAGSGRRRAGTKARCPPEAAVTRC